MKALSDFELWKHRMHANLLKYTMPFIIVQLNKTELSISLSALFKLAVESLDEDIALLSTLDEKNKIPKDAYIFDRCNFYLHN